MYRRSFRNVDDTSSHANRFAPTQQQGGIARWYPFAEPGRPCMPDSDVAQQGYDSMRRRHREWFRRRPKQEREILRDAQLRAHQHQQQHQRQENNQPSLVGQNNSHPNIVCPRSRHAPPTSDEIRQASEPVFRGLLLQNEYSRPQAMPQPGEGGLNAMDIISARQRQPAPRTNTRPRGSFSSISPSSSASQPRVKANPDGHTRSISSGSRSLYSGSSTSGCQIAIKSSMMSLDRIARMPADWQTLGLGIIPDVQSQHVYFPGPGRKKGSISRQAEIESHHGQLCDGTNESSSSIYTDCHSRVSPSDQSLRERYVNAKLDSTESRPTSMRRYRSVQSLPVTDEESAHPYQLHEQPNLKVVSEVRATRFTGPVLDRTPDDEENPKTVDKIGAAVSHNKHHLNFSRPFYNQGRDTPSKRDICIQPVLLAYTESGDSALIGGSSTASLGGDATASASQQAKVLESHPVTDAFAIFERDVERPPRSSLFGDPHIGISGNFMHLASIDDVLDETRAHEPDTQLRFRVARSEKWPW